MNAGTSTIGTAEPPGGSGGPSAPASPPVPTKADCRLLELALRENWDIPLTTIAATVAGLSAVITDDEARKKRPRLWLRCVQALAALSRKNLAAVETAARVKALEGGADATLDELARKLREADAAYDGD